MLSIENLSFVSQTGKSILKNVNMHIKEGEIVGLVGGSGSGKSTVFYSLFPGIFPSRGGSFSGKINLRESLHPLLQDAMSGFNPLLSVGRSLREPFDIRGIKNPTKKIYELLERVGMADIDLNLYPSSFSGGQMQRLNILRALLSHSKYWIMDEPVSGLDPLVRKDVLDLIMEIHKKDKPGILFISHDLEVVEEICERVYVMKDGVIIEEGRFPDFPKISSNDYTKILFNPWGDKKIVE